LIQIPGGTYSDDPHEYRDEQGKWIPGLTNTFKLCSMSDFSGADPDDMANAARRGTALHELVEVWNREGDCDPSWITPELDGYFTGYRKFLIDTGFVCDPEWTERPLIATIRGMRLGMKPDVFGKLRRDKAIVEIKAASSVQATWSVQTGMQELGIHASNNVGRVRRFALQLFRDGRYKLHEHVNHQQDEAIGIAALRLVWWRLEQGQKLWLAAKL